MRKEVLRLGSVDDERGAPPFLANALDALGISPENPGAPLDDLQTLLGWLARRYPLVGVYEDRDEPGSRYIGAIVSVSGTSLIVRAINRRGVWTGEFDHSLAAITRVDFDDGYLRALASVGGK